MEVVTLDILILLMDQREKTVFLKNIFIVMDLVRFLNIKYLVRFNTLMTTVYQNEDVSAYVWQ